MVSRTVKQLEKLSNSIQETDASGKGQYYNNFRKNKRTASVADSQIKRGFNNSVNISSFNHEKAYRYMSVTPSHKHHDMKKGKLFMDIPGSSKHSNMLKTSTHRTQQEKMLKKNKMHAPIYKSNMAIEEVKDEYNDSKLSFNAEESTISNRKLDLDIQAMILVEDKICTIANNVAQEYWEVTIGIYTKINEQFDILAGELKHIKTIKTTLILEYMVVILITLFGHDSKMHKATLQQFKSLNYYVHQNILLLIDEIIVKLSPNENNKEWMSNLKSIIDSKLAQMAVKTVGLNNKQQPKLDIIKQN